MNMAQIGYAFVGKLVFTKHGNACPTIRRGCTRKKHGIHIELTTEIQNFDLYIDPNDTMPI